MKRLYYPLIVLAALVLSAHMARAQQATDPSQIPLAPPALQGTIETANGRFRLNLANTDEARRFQGTALVSLGNSSQFAEAAKIPVALGPREAQLFPLPATASGEQFMLMVYDTAGALVFSKMAPVKHVTDAAPAFNEPVASYPLPGAAPPAPVEKGEVKVQARLAGGETENAPLVLAFDVASPTPLVKATFSVKAKNLNQTKPITIRGHASVEFPLPDAFNDPKVSYTLTDASGKVLAQGEADLDRLFSEDYASVADVQLDRQAYTPGESVRAVLALQGNTQHGYRLEVLAKDGRGAVFYRDTRKGSNDGGKSSQEINFQLPADASGPVTFEFKVFDAETGVLFDSGDRELPLAKVNAAPAKSP